jgi:predicted lactoylglutathione lyase
MISHFNLGTNDLPRAEAFFDALLALMNGRQAFKNERTILYAFSEDGAKIAINTPHNGQPATAGNGSMVALGAADKAQVEAVHAKALELGGSCEGKPGGRMNDMLYAAYFRDLDGNKFGIFCSTN